MENEKISQYITPASIVARFVFLLFAAVLIAGVYGQKAILYSGFLQELNYIFIWPLVLPPIFILFFFAKGLFPKFWFLFPLAFFATPSIKEGVSQFLTYEGFPIDRLAIAGLYFRSYLTILIIASLILIGTKRWVLHKRAYITAVICVVISFVGLSLVTSLGAYIEKGRGTLYVPTGENIEISEVCIDGCGRNDNTVYYYQVLHGSPATTIEKVSYKRVGFMDSLNTSKVCSVLESNKGISKDNLTKHSEVNGTVIYHLAVERTYDDFGDKAEKPYIADYYCFVKGLLRYEVSGLSSSNTEYSIETLVNSLTSRSISTGQYHPPAVKN